jgi:DNA-binding CsgD family transcriptional regulator
MINAGDSYRLIADRLNISKSTVSDIVQRQRD